MENHKLSITRKTNVKLDSVTIVSCGSECGHGIFGNTVTVQVGSVEHHMLDVHFIQWVAVEYKEGVQIKYLQPGQAPKAVFALSEGDELVAVYEYCNLHGLWKA